MVAREGHRARGRRSDRRVAGRVYATSRFVESFLFKVKSNDPLAISAVIAILLAAAILAGYVPAERAARIDPMAALRQE